MFLTLMIIRNILFYRTFLKGSLRCLVMFLKLLASNIEFLLWEHRTLQGPQSIFSLFIFIRYL